MAIEIIRLNDKEVKVIPGNDLDKRFWDNIEQQLHIKNEEIKAYKKEITTLTREINFIKKDKTNEL